MSLSKRTPLDKIKREASPHKTHPSFPNWENFKCDIHPQLQIQALHLNKYTKSFSLVCIKCIIEGDYLRSEGEDELITLNDLLDTYSRNLNKHKTTTTAYKSPDSLQEKFVGFLIKDYLGTYERHLESQYNTIDQEIEETIEKLHRVREKYKQYYDKELKAVKEQGAEIKNKINKLLEGNRNQDMPVFTSMDEIYNQLNKIEENTELINFLQDLYFQSKEQSNDVTVTGDCHKLLASMENWKEKALNAKEREVDILRFKDIQQNLQSLLQSDSTTFKRSIEGIPKHMKLDPESSGFGLLEPSYHLNDVHNTISQFSHSPTRQDEMTYTAPRHRTLDRDSEATVKKKKKSRFNEIDSQSLRNLKRKLEKNEDENEGLSSQEVNREKVVASLNDWVNRRITGYLVFQNSMNSDPEIIREKTELTEMGVHLNQAMGKKWKSLTEKEKEEYKALAREFRKAFKQEIEEHENVENTTELLAYLDEKIKKLKKE